MSAPVGWGILGAGRISTLAVGPALAASQLCHIAAIGARHADRAAALGSRLAEPGDASPRAYGSYEQVIADPAVEVVYIALPNDAHLPWALEALRADKHVLCEKPLGLDAAEVAAAFDVAEETGALLVEASWYRWHPRTQEAERMIAEGELGRVASVDASFVFDGVPVGDFRMDPGRGGGALYDVGCYAVSAVGWATGWAGVTRPEAEVRTHDSGVDLATSARFEAGDAAVTVRAAIDQPAAQRLEIHGTAGTLRFGPPAFTAWSGGSAALEVAGVDGSVSIREFPPVDPYRRMVDAVAGRVRGRDEWVVPRRDSEWVAAVLDTLRARPGETG